MGIQDVAEKIRAQVESGGFEHSVKFDTGADGVIVIDGATISTADALPTAPSRCRWTTSNRSFPATSTRRWRS